MVIKGFKMGGSIMKTSKLALALQLLEKIESAQIIKIEFEDGSGNKFNYDTTDESNKFIDFTKYLSWQLALIEQSGNN